MDTDTPALQQRKSRAMQATLATMLSMHGFGRHAPPARLFRQKEESSRRKAAAEAKRERRRQRNVIEAANLHFNAKVPTP